MFLSGLFSRFSDAKRLLKRKRSLSSSRRSRLYEASMEQLEQKRLLTVEFYGIAHTNTSGTTNENYVYQVGVTTEGTGDVYMRYNAQNDSIYFDDNQSFSNLQTGYFGSGSRGWEFYSSGFHQNPIATTAGGNGGFHLRAQNTFPSKILNSEITEDETFTSQSVSIIAEDGTNVYLVNGDALPISLFVNGNSFASRARPVGATASGALGTASRPTQTGGVPNLIAINAPINDVGNAWAGHDTSLSAENIIIDAAVTTPDLGLQVGSPGAASASDNQLIELRNTINSTTDVYVETGTFKLNAGATINGNTEIAVGTDGSGVGFGGFGGDIEINGTVNGSSVTLQTNSSDRDTHISTGPSGVISGGGSLTLFNAGLDGGTIDVQTKNYSVTNVNVGTPTALLPDIGISIDQTAGDLTIAAVPTSRGQISLKASGGANALINVDAGISTAGGLRLEAGQLIINSPLDTEAGNIDLYGNSVTVGSNIHAGSSGVGNIYIESLTGNVSLQSASTIQADTGTITINADDNITSEATLEASLLKLEAGGLITAGSNSEKLRATAAASIDITADDDMVVELAVTNAGNLDITSLGELDIQSVSALGAGNVGLIGGSGVTINRLRTANGKANVSAATGNISIEGEVIVQGDTDDNLSLTADTGNIIVHSDAVVSVADQIILSAEKGRILTPGELVDIEITDPGSGYTAATIDISIDAGSGATAVPTLTSGGVASIRVTNGGSDYVTRPTVTLLGGGGTNASAEAVISNGVVTSVNLTNVGSGYTSAPQVVFSGGSGQGATAESLVDGVLNISVTNPGSGYLTPPEVVISAGEGATSGGITINDDGEIQSIHLASNGFDYGQSPLVVITDASGSGSGASATANLDTGITSYMIAPGGTGYETPPVVTVTGGGGSGATIISNIAGPLDNGNVLGNGHNGIQLTNSGGDGYTQDVQVTIIGDGQDATASVDIHGSIGGDPVTLSGSSSDNAYPHLNHGSLTISSGGSYSVDPNTADPASPTWLKSTLETQTLANGATVDLTPLYGLDSPNSLAFTAGNKTYTAAYWTGPAPAGGGTTASGWMTISDTGVIDGFNLADDRWDPGSGYDGSEFFDASGAPDPNAFTITGFGAGGTGTPTTVQVSETVKFQLTGGSWDITSGSNDGLTEDESFIYLGNNTPGDNEGRMNLEVTGEIDGTTLTVGNPGSGYTTAPTVSFLDDNHSGALATAQTYINGSVTSLNILQSGSGYNAGTPSINIGLPSGTGTPANAIARLSQVVSSITVDQAGTNYNPATTTVELEIVSGGTGALVSPIEIDNAGGILGINVSTPGIDYVTPPTVVINDLSSAGTGASADALLGIGLVVIDDVGSGYSPSSTFSIIVPSNSGAPADAAELSVSIDSSGEIASIAITKAGTNFTGQPTFTIVDPSTAASNAVVSAYMSVVGVGNITPGANYDATQTVVDFVTAGSGAKAVANLDSSGTVASITMVSSGSGYTVDPIVRIDGYGSNAVAAGNIVGGIVDSTTITQPGSNYAVPPVVTFDLTPNQAAATATLTGDAVTGHTMAAGGVGYTPPTTPGTATIPVTFSASPTGDTATGLAISDGAGVITGISISHAGSGYTTTPTITIDPTAIGNTSYRKRNYWKYCDGQWQPPFLDRTGNTYFGVCISV